MYTPDSGLDLIRLGPLCACPGLLLLAVGRVAVR
jgi:hypothetical protein